MKIKNSKLSGVVFSALFAAVLCIVSQIAIPTPFGIPFTLQTFAVALCGYLLSVSCSVSVVMVYITLGVIGLPVFSHFRGGAQLLFSSTGGFLIGFLILAAACSFTEKLPKDILKIASGLIGLIVCHLIGITVFSLVSNSPFFEAALVSSLPFLIKDIVSVITAFYIAKKLKKQRF